ncbi:5-dehydro-4-deoxyglucarate dehydratase [Murinocardiopsis flavida]|uniref:Probable 5-dehydro-4-deoxyglucarate dehydratase n=1 Tax=Murinocardiopsis flavida TaxID=645275 RepID=A0A2P8DKR9_9ACTN|nr:5-dehydro-4-deoxyglucarate dehydratase [Murinocardiopsis flavida]PSK97798.1 5-dehydro-4-deoxyglucarate dehydratase [Murinocardiopsis flavida]
MQLEGILFFPVTPFRDDGGVDEGALAAHVDAGVAAGAGGVFAACGTGEFNALAPAELETVTRVAVAAAAGRVPVLAAAGGPVPVAQEQARRIEGAGADGILLLPPYLVTAPQQGLVDYAAAVTSASGLDAIFYQRANAVPSPETAVHLARLPRVSGIKDGVGDIELMQRTVLRVRQEVDEDFRFFNGLPTAEITVPAYRGLGVSLYSSAAFAFVPEVALAFNRAVTGGDDATVRLLLDEFYAPFAALRDEVPGYAVALVKAGVRLRGHAVGGVRPPLRDPGTDHVDRLAKLIEHGLGLVA